MVDEPELPDQGLTDEPEPDALDAPEPDEPEADAPDVPEPDVPDEPEPDAPDGPEPLDDPDGPNDPDAPATDDASDTPETSEASNASDTSDEPDSSDEPGALDATEPPEDPGPSDGPDVPQMPSFNLPGLPGFPKLPNLNINFPRLPNLNVNFPKLPNLPNFPNLPSLPTLPSLPNLPDLPHLPDAPRLPDLPGALDVPPLPGVPGAPNVPGVPGTPGMPTPPGARNMPGTPNTPGAADVPGSPNTPGSLNTQRASPRTAEPSSTSSMSVKSGTPAASEAGHDNMVGAVLELYAPPSGSGTDPVLVEEVPFQFNPARLELVKEAAWARHNGRSAPHASVPEFTGSRPRTLAMTVMLDEPDPGRRTVDERVSKLLEFCRPTEGSLDAKQPSTPWARFRWGGFESVSFMAYLRTVKATYTRFSPQGNPLRAVCDLVLEEIGGTTKRQNPTSGSPSSQRSCTLVRGDSLQSVAFRSSGRPADWRRIAELNGVEDPSKVQPGRTLLLPGTERT